MAPYLNHFTLLQLLLTISLVYVATVTCTVSSLSHDEECLALFQFKQSIIHQHDEACATSWFHTFDSWKPTSNASDAVLDCCSWYGVKCSNDHEYGHVVGLDLSESFLCGHINSNTTLFSLVHLQSLNLAFNNFLESQIPSEIAHLKQLRSLNLSDSGFTGQVPNEISQLIQLSSLDLSQNALKLQRPSGFKNLVQNLTRLEELDLSGGDISSSVPHVLANFSSLTSIRLKDCSLQNEFPAAIFKLPKLKTIDVYFNTNLTGFLPEFRNNILEHVNLAYTSFSGIVPESISNLNHLTVFSLTRCSFSGHIPDTFSNLTELTALGLASNNFIGFVPSLVSLSKLGLLELSGNKFEKRCLPSWLGKLTELNKLYLSNMNIASEIPSFLANLTKLSVIEMGENSLNGHIPPSFFNLTQLRMLNLEGNRLQGPISTSFSYFKSLRYLGLEFNNFSGSVDLNMFLGLNKLRGLLLGYNKISVVAGGNHTNNTLQELEHLDLTSCNLKEFPTLLRFQNKMTDLLLGDNKINGVVPSWIWNNSQETLQLIDLSANYITGFHQHPHILPWGHLEGFFIDNNRVQGQVPIPPQTIVAYDVSNNNLTGEIPPLLCEAKSLQLLDLSSNSLSGTLPPCFGSLSNSLLVLSLRHNNFYGNMMNAFRHGCMLKSLDLSENGFTGQLPRLLTNCSNLEILSLGDNSFDDIFPFWLGSLSKLRVLILRSNKFHGPIQGSTTIKRLQFPRLRIIDLSNNGFSGQLPQKYFQTWNGTKSFYLGEISVMESEISSRTFLINLPYSMTLIHKGVRTEYEKILTLFTSIDLSCNEFEGKIPQSLQYLQGLESLNLSNNHFTGRVLPWLGKLRNLEALDLSQNKLWGEIPQELVQLDFLSIFNVSFNHLYGRIPEAQQFSTFDNDSYMGNPGLCGKPLSKECQNSKMPRLPPTSKTTTRNTWFESLLPSERIDWIIISSGVGSGLAIGIFIGNFLHTRYSDGFIKTNE